MIKKLAAILLAGALALGFVVPVHAVTIDPPDTMEILSARGYLDLAETGDAAVVFHWAVTYTGANTTADYPAVPASDSIIFQLFSDTGDMVATAAPYVYAPFDSNGYNQGVSSFYIDADDGLTPGAGYVVKIVQNPLYFAAPTTTSYVMSADDWSLDTSADMKTYVLSLCVLLLSEYDVTLHTPTDVGFVLNAYGESYYLGATPGMRALCPTLFYTQDYSPEMMPTTAYNTDLQDSYSIRMQGSEIKRGADRLGAHLGLTGYFILGIFILAGCVGCAIVTQRRGWGLESGMIAASILGIFGAIAIGNAVFTVVMIGTLVAVIAIMFTFLGRRA